MIGKLCAAALLSAFMGFMLSEYGWRGKRAFSAVCALLIMCAVLPELSRIFGTVDRLTEATGISDIAVAAMKVVGVGYIFGLTSEVCCELGEAGLSRCCSLVCKVEIFLIVMPYFEELVIAATELI